MLDAEHDVHPDSHSIEGFPCDMPHKSYERHGHREGSAPFTLYFWKDSESLEAFEIRKAEMDDVRWWIDSGEVNGYPEVKAHLVKYAKILEQRL